nr:hypothetical protein [Bacteroidota bacterium]
MRKFYIVFFFVNLLLGFYFIDVWNNANTTSRALPVITFWENGSFQIDRYHELTMDKANIDGHYYTDKPPMATLIVLPFFGLLEWVGVINYDEGSLYGPAVYILGDFLCGSIPFALIILLAFRSIRTGKFRFSPVLLVMMSFFGSFLFVFSGTFFAHLLTGLLLLLAYINIKNNKFFYSGFFLGLAFLSEYIVAIVMPVWALQVWIREKNFMKSMQFGLGILPAVIFIMAYNYAFTGNPLEMLYKYDMFGELHTNYGFSLPTIESIWGLSFSNFKGVFFYAPILILILFTVFRNKSLRTIGRHYLTYVSVVYFLVISSYFGWWGGWTYGPRHLIPLAILLIYEGVILLSCTHFNKPLFWGLTLFGLTGAFLAKLTVLYSVPSESVHPFVQTIFPALLSGNLNPNNILTMVFSIPPVVADIIWLCLFVASMLLLSKWNSRIQMSSFAVDLP